jgi:hypothetical protein
MDSKVINASEIERTNGEATLHRFLVLLIADVVQQKASTRVGAVLLQKILFQVRRSLQRLRHPELSMVFVRYHFGPYSFTVANDEDFLKEAGLLTAVRG